MNQSVVDIFDNSAFDKIPWWEQNVRGALKRKEISQSEYNDLMDFKSIMENESELAIMKHVVDKEISKQDYTRQTASYRQAKNKIEAQEQNIGKVAGRKIAQWWGFDGNTYKNQQSIEVMRKRDNLIANIMEDFNMDQFDASDFYDSL